MYAMHNYECCNVCFGRVKKLTNLKKVMEAGMQQHNVDYNLDQFIIDLKTRKLAQRRKSIRTNL